MEWDLWWERQWFFQGNSPIYNVNANSEIFNHNHNPTLSSYLSVSGFSTLRLAPTGRRVLKVYLYFSMDPTDLRQLTDCGDDLYLGFMIFRTSDLNLHRFGDLWMKCESGHYGLFFCFQKRQDDKWILWYFNCLTKHTRYLFTLNFQQLLLLSSEDYLDSSSE